MRSPYAAGSAYVMLHHAFGEVNGKKGVWGHHRRHGRDHPGDGDCRPGARCGNRNECKRARDRCRRKACSRCRARRWTDHPRKICRGERRPKTALYAAVARRCAARHLSHPHQELAQRLRDVPDKRSAPSFSALPGAGDHLSAGIIIAPGLNYMDRAWQDARKFGWSHEPVIKVLIPSVIDELAAAAMWPAFAASMSRRNCPARPGMTIAIGRRPHDRDRRPLRGGLCRLRDRPAGPVTARPRTRIWIARRRHLPRRADAEPVVLG